MPEIRNMTPEELQRFERWKANQPSLMDQWDMVRQQERGDAETDPASEALFDTLTPGGGFFDTIAAKALAGGTGMAILGRLPNKSELKSQGLLKKLDDLRKEAWLSNTRAQSVGGPKVFPGISEKAGTDALLEMDAENKFINYLKGKKRLNPRDLENADAYLLEQLPGKQRKQVMQTMFNDYRQAGIPAGIDEITGRVFMGNYMDPMWNIYGNPSGSVPNPSDLKNMLREYEIADTFRRPNVETPKTVEAYPGKNESMRLLTDLRKRIDKEGLGYDPLPNRSGPVQNIFDDGSANIEEVTPQSNVISLTDWIKKKGK